MSRNSSGSAGANRSNRIAPIGYEVLNQAHPTILVANIGGSSNPDIVMGLANGDAAYAGDVAVGSDKKLLCAGTRDGKRRKAFAVTHSDFNSDKIFIHTVSGAKLLTIFHGETKGFETDDDFAISGSNTKTYCTILETFYI